MAYLCNYEFCKEGKVIKEGTAVGCTKCRSSKAMHGECCRQHNLEKHAGKATCKPIAEVDLHFRML